MPSRVAPLVCLLALVLLLAAACRPTAAAAPACLARPTQPFSDAAVVERSHAFVEAFAAGDAEAVDPLAAPSFVKIQGGRFMERARMMKRFGERAGAAYPRVEARTWSGDRVRRAADGTIVYTGFTSSRFVRAEGADPVASERFVMLVWVAGEPGWQVALYQVADAGVEAERQYWNEAFREGTGFNTQPNRFLMEVVKGRKPGKALDVAMGQGRNAVFLASAGWQVTGVDISEEALRQAQETAKREGLTITTVQHDVDTWDFGTAQWDLICFIYAGGGRDMVERVRRSLKPGGIVVIEFFLADSVKDIGISGFKPNELLELYGTGFKVVSYDEVEDKPDWGPGKAKLVRFVAQRI